MLGDAAVACALAWYVATTATIAALCRDKIQTGQLKKKKAKKPKPSELTTRNWGGMFSNAALRTRRGRDGNGCKHVHRWTVEFSR
jgi:hypothetical protein